MKKVIQFANVIICIILLASCAKESESDSAIKSQLKTTAPTDISWSELSSNTNGTISQPPSDYDYQHPEWLSTSTVYLVDETSLGGKLMEVYVFNSTSDLHAARNGGVTQDHTYQNGSSNSCGGCTYECTGAELNCYVVETDDGHVIVTCE